MTKTVDRLGGSRVSMRVFVALATFALALCGLCWGAQAQVGSSATPAAFETRNGVMTADGLLRAARAVAFACGPTDYRAGSTEASKPPITASLAPEYRSPKTAFLLSLVSTIVPAAVGVGLLKWSDEHRGSNVQMVAGISSLGLALLAGPSVGHFYADENHHAWITSLVRTGAGLLGGILVGSSTIGTADCADSGRACEDKTGLWFGYGFWLAGSALAVFDIVDAPYAAQRTNARHGLTNLGVVPVVVKSGDSTSHGLALAGQF